MKYNYHVKYFRKNMNVDFASLSAFPATFIATYTCFLEYFPDTRSLQTSFVLATNMEKRTYLVRVNKKGVSNRTCRETRERLAR